MHSIKTNFDKIIGVIKDILSHEINEKGNYTRRGIAPKFSDMEVMPLILKLERMFGSEYIFCSIAAKVRKFEREAF